MGRESNEENDDQGKAEQAEGYELNYEWRRRDAIKAGSKK